MRAKIIAATALALVCCVAAMPGDIMTPAELLEAYRETVVARDCSHGPYRCLSRDYHAQRLVIDELCPHEPHCSQIKDCLKKHIEFVFELGCFHAPKCSQALGHYNEIRHEQGLRPIDVR